MAKRILLADDSVTAQNMGRKILNDAGYDVVTVNNGSAALKRIAENAPELIVLDVYMPGYTGLEVCQRIKGAAETAAIPVLLTVGKLEPFKAEEAKRVHADAFIIKPFEATELLTVLAKLEDKIAPQPAARSQQAKVSARSAKQGAVETAAAGKPSPEKAELKFGDSEAGWKNRIAIPSRAPEAEPEKPAPTAFHDLRSTRLVEEEASAEPAFAVNLPPDITSEEIAAISAAAASLTGEEVPEPPAEPVAEFQTQPAADHQIPAPEWEVAASQLGSEVEPDDVHQNQVAVSEILANENGNAAALAESPAVDLHEHESVVAASEAAPQEEQAFTTFASVPPAESGEQESPEHDSPGEFAVAVADAAHRPQEEEHVAAAVAGITEGASSAESEPQMVASTETEAAPAAQLSDSEVAAALESLVPVESAAVVAAVASSGLRSSEAAPEAPGAASSLVENLYAFKWIAQEVPVDEGVSALILEQEMQKVYAAIGPPDAQSVAAAAESEIERDSVPQSVQPADDLHSGVLEASAVNASEAADASFIAAGSEAIVVREPLEESAISEQSAEEQAASLTALGFVARPESEARPAVEVVGEHAENAEAVEAAELEAAAQLEPTPESQPTVEAVASDVVMPSGEELSSTEAVSIEAGAAAHESAQEEPAALAAAASASSAANSASATELTPEPATVAAQPAQGPPSTRWDDDDQPPDVAAAWARWRQIRDSLATPEFTSQVAEAAAAELAAAESHAAPAADFAAANFKDIRHDEPIQPQAEPAPKAAAAAASADSAAISSIVESVLAELKPRLVEEIARKLGKK